MNLSEEKIKQIALQTFIDLQYSLGEKDIEKIWFEKEDQSLIDEDNVEINPNWIIALNDPIFDSSFFLTISDKTGIPLFFQTKHKKIMLALSEEGKVIEK